ncbi:hypothetical protein HY501_02410 [Candidatus Woesearchaeota archaeon]|nr:hypothetical protein [Candidatus Woesearchaeota archaeon]
MGLRQLIAGTLAAFAIGGCAAKYKPDESGLCIPRYSHAPMLAKGSTLSPEMDWVSWKAYDLNRDLKADLIEVSAYPEMISTAGSVATSVSLFADSNYDGFMDLIYVDMAHGESDYADGKYDVVVSASFALESRLRRPATREDMKVKNFMKLMMEEEK